MAMLSIFTKGKCNSSLLIEMINSIQERGDIKKLIITFKKKLRWRLQRLRAKLRKGYLQRLRSKNLSKTLQEQLMKMKAFIHPLRLLKLGCIIRASNNKCCSIEEKVIQSIWHRNATISNIRTIQMTW